MSLVDTYRSARRAERVARVRRAVALRAMRASGMRQHAIADALGVSQPAVSQQLRSGPEPDGTHPEVLLEAAAPVLKALATERGFTDLAVFGSVARRQARQDSDIDLIVRSPAEASSFDLMELKLLFEQVLGREVDLIDYGGLKPTVDDDILRDTVPL